MGHWFSATKSRTEQGMSVFVWWGEMAIQIHHCLEVNQKDVTE
jgi:hypothetical protein